VRILGANLATEHTIVLLGADGRMARLLQASSIPAAATAVAQLAAGEPFVLGIDVPLAGTGRETRSRSVDNLLRRRLGFRAAAATGGETLLTALAAVGQPCLPYPDRDRRQSGLAETHPRLALKALLWEGSHFAGSADQASRETLFRAFEPPSYRPTTTGRSRIAWSEAAVALDLVVRALGAVAGFDLDPVRAALARVGSAVDAERAAGTFDALLAAGTVRRYLEAPETCLFLGSVEQGYVILPADGLVRRLALTGRAAASPRLFPQTSLRERLGREAQVRAIDLLDLPGRPQRLEVTFRDEPHYEFDNLDEMLWWKHARHLTGPTLPVEGLSELQVALGPETGSNDGSGLRLLRSRHRTLSFRFEPAVAWRARCPTRDGRTYPFRVLRALYETLPQEN
jgi:hypothetical protein